MLTRLIYGIVFKDFNLKIIAKYSVLEIEDMKFLLILSSKLYHGKKTKPLIYKETLQEILYFRALWFFHILFYSGINYYF